ncbi:MAG: cytochrome c3 family protein [Verrucomicrobia bacterium]|nr:cytochrome c3 family protein [Verrucomicrobiota bacterium]
MGQLFHPNANAIAKISIFGGVFIVAALVWAAAELYRSPYVTRAGDPISQPVPFSHKHHVSDVGIDCRYCHASVERSSFAGIPPTKTCIGCHAILWADAPMLEPVRKSFQTGDPIRWKRVNYLPQFVFFNHSIHVNKGIGCTSCHGPVGEMPLTWQQETLHMRWCLDCHENPEKFVRPVEEVFNPHWKPPANQLEQGRKLVKQHNIKKLNDCYTCHR